MKESMNGAVQNTEQKAPAPTGAFDPVTGARLTNNPYIGKPIPVIDGLIEEFEGHARHNCDAIERLDAEYKRRREPHAQAVSQAANKLTQLKDARQYAQQHGL